MNYRKHNDMNPENALTLEERYKLMPGVAVTDGEHVIRGWLKRNTPLTMDDYTTMLALRGYDMNRYAWCLETDDVPVNGQLPWERVLDEILKHVDGIDSPANGDYATFIMPFVKYAMRHILDTAIRGPLMWNEDACVEACATALSGRLLQIALKTLVWVFRREMNPNEDTHMLSHPAFSNHDEFIVWLGTREAYDAVFGSYPVLARKLTETTVRFIDFIREFAMRVEHDAEDIRCFLHITERLRVGEITLDSGDCHDGGRSVILLTVNEGKRIVYKPRRLSIHGFFRRLAGECERYEGFLPLRVPDILDEGDYAFEEYVERHECRNEHDIEDYFTRYGELIALIWFLNGNDMHYENIVPDGAYPRIIDYETVAANRVSLRRSLPQADDMVLNRLGCSTLANCLLPSRMPLGDQGQKVDISALDPHDQTIHDGALVPVGLDSDLPRYERHDVVVSKNGIAVRQGRDVVNPAEYGTYIIRGFDKTIDVLQNIPEEYIDGLFDTHPFTSRIVARSTSGYARFLGFTNHPSVLRDMRNVESVLENLYAYPYRDRRICLSEYDQLLNGDIPMFTAESDSRSMTGCDGTVIADAFDRSIRQLVLERKRNLMKEVPLERRILRNALGGFDAKNPVSYTLCGDDTSVRCDRASYMNMVERFVHAMTDDAYVGDGTISWMVARRDEEQGDEERYSPGMPDKDLYMGQGGICLLMAQLAHENGDIRLKTLADYCRRSLVGVRAANATPSAFSGMMSQVYVAMRLDHICGNPQVNDYLKRAAHDFPMLVNDIIARLTSETTIGEGVPSSVNLDYLTGASGAMALYLRLQNMYGNDSLRNPLCRLADTVMDSATRLWADTVNDDVETFPSGAAHGMEGMAVTFWRLFRRMGERRYGEFAHDLWRHAMGRRGAQGERSGIKWCRGDIGVLWAQNELESVNGPENEPFFNTDTPPAYQDKEGIGRLLESARWTDDTVCHGRCGAIDTLVSMYHTHQDDWYLRQARGLLDDMVAEAQHAGHFRLGRIPEFVDSSYFLGPVGIAYTMLRVQDPSIPSILALEIGEQEQDND